MKYILSFFLSLSVLCTSLSAVEYGFLHSYEEEASLTLNAGDKLEILMYTGSFYTNYLVPDNIHSNALKAYDLNNNLLFTYSLNANSMSGPTYYGPSKIVLVTQSNSGQESHFSRVQYRLTRASEVEYKNINIIALPSSTVGQGTHEIVVEASDDLQTWTPVHSSSIGGSKAFFRTRVVEAGE